MGAGKQESPVFAVCQRQRADDLRFLAAHHIAHRSCRIVHARHDAETPIAERHRREAGRELGQSRGAAHVGRLDPSLPAADHAGHDDGNIVRRAPAADLRLQHASEIAVIHRQDAVRTGGPVDHCPRAVDQERAEGAGPPVDADECGHTRHVRDVVGAGQAKEPGAAGAPRSIPSVLRSSSISGQWIP